MLYRHVLEKLDRHFGLNPITNNFPIGRLYRNNDFRLSATLYIGMHEKTRLPFWASPDYPQLSYKKSAKKW